MALWCGLGAGRAQTNSGIVTGRVVDPQGQSIPAAEVVLTQESTGVKQRTATDSTGDFVFPSVLPGRYIVSVQVQGFKRFEKKDLTLTASDRLPVGTLALEIGNISDSVTVTADATPIQTASQERSAVLNDKQMSSLSAAGRDYLNLLKVLPGVTYPDSGGNDSLGVSTAPNINGSRGDYTALNMDGVVANTRGWGATENPLNLDAIAEVKVLLGNYQAEYGRKAGAIVNMVTKGGTRAFHGAGYWYKRHEMFNANDFFNNLNSLPKTRYRYTTIGYNVGGPVYWGDKFNRNKDKLFFFFSQEIQPNIKPGSLRTYTVPTDLERRGDFSQSREPNGALIPVKDPLNGQAFPGNVVPAGRINTNLQKLLGVFPAPNFLDRAISKGNYNYVLSDSSDNPVHQEVLRLDYNPSEKWRIYFRGMNMGVNLKGTDVTANTNKWGVVQSYDTTNPNVGFNVTFLPSPTMVNELSVGLGRWTEKQNIADSELAKLQQSALGIDVGQWNPANNPLKLVPAATFGGVTNAAPIGYDARFPMSNYVNAYSFSEALTKVAGAHTLKAGIYYEDSYYPQPHNGANFAGSFDFTKNASNPFDANHPYANALLGNFLSYTEVDQRLFYQGVNKVLEWYLQDNWKVSSKLTLDYGIRFTYDLPAYYANDVAGTFDSALYVRSKAPVLFSPGKDANGARVAVDPRTGKTYPVAYIGLFVPGSGDPNNGAVKAGTPGRPRGFMESNGVLFAPRFGFAYDPFGDGKTAIRGGFGMFYNAQRRSGELGDLVFNPPVQAMTQAFYGNVTSFLAATGLQGPSDFRKVAERNAKILSTYQMSMGVQRSLGHGAMLDVAYSGTLGRNLGQTRDINLVPYGSRFQNLDPTTGKPLPDNFFRPYYGFGAMPYFEFAGTSSYHSLQTQVKRSFSHGLQFGVAWTWSKAMNYGDNYDARVATFVSPRIFNYGPAGYDRTHALVANWVWDIPKASSLWKNAFVHAALDNWQMSGIAAFVSGSPRGITLSLSDAADLTGGGDGNSVVMTGNAILSKGDRTFSRYFNTQVFQRPALGSIGTGAGATRYAFRGPGINNWDMTLFKNIPVKEKIAFQFRWEMYNAFNHTQFNGVNTTARFDAPGNQINAQFGQITSSRSPRVQQLSLRVTF